MPAAHKVTVSWNFYEFPILNDIPSVDTEYGGLSGEKNKDKQRTPRVKQMCSTQMGAPTEVRYFAFLSPSE